MRTTSRVKRVAATFGVAVTVLAPAAPAAATYVEQQCRDARVDTATGDSYSGTACVAADTGLYEPVYTHCSAMFGCWARVTVGHDGSGEFDVATCFGEVGTDDACAGVGPAEVTLVYVEPQYTCFNDSPWGPSCAPREVDEQ